MASFGEQSLSIQFIPWLVEGQLPQAEQLSFIS